MSIFSYLSQPFYFSFPYSPLPICPFLSFLGFHAYVSTKNNKLFVPWAPNSMWRARALKHIIMTARSIITRPVRKIILLCFPNSYFLFIFINFFLSAKLDFRRLLLAYSTFSFIFVFFSARRVCRYNQRSKQLTLTSRKL